MRPELRSRAGPTFRRSSQLPLYPKRGGHRPGAGRKPKGERAGVSHATRAKISRHHPVHVTTRVVSDVRSLRRGARFRAVRRALAAGGQRGDFRVVEFSIMSNHIHLLCEAGDRAALSRGVQGLLVRMARALNRASARTGKVFGDRYHDRVLRTPREVRNALAYVLNNARRHALERGRQMACGWLDPCSSAPAFHGRLVSGEDAVTASPRTWLLRFGWQRAGPVTIDEVPGSRRTRRRVSAG